jgi:hypothetical protein
MYWVSLNKQYINYVQIIRRYGKWRTPVKTVKSLRLNTDRERFWADEQLSVHQEGSEVLRSWACDLLLMVSYLAYTYVLKKEATCYSEASCSLRITRHYSPEDCTIREGFCSVNFSESVVHLYAQMSIQYRHTLPAYLRSVAMLV